MLTHLESLIPTVESPKENASSEVVKATVADVLNDFHNILARCRL